jgi:hypothetical protein
VALQDLNVSSPAVSRAGMFGLWRPEAFAQVADLDSWEDEVADNSALVRHIGAGEFVPINIGADGAFQFALRGRIGATTLSNREAAYCMVTSEPYLLRSNGSVELGGLEAVGSYSGEPKVKIPLDGGAYSVVISLIDWKAEPGAANAQGKPTADALPDFIIEVSDAQIREIAYRSKVETFDRK